jgi:hypothetical protein
MGEMRNFQKIVAGKLEGKILLGRSNHRWEDNIKVGLQHRLPLKGK